MKKESSFFLMDTILAKSPSITLRSLNRSLDIFEQVFAGFEADAQADGGVGDGHRSALFIGEETEDGGGGMDGQ